MYFNLPFRGQYRGSSAANRKRAEDLRKANDTALMLARGLYHIDDPVKRKRACEVAAMTDPNVSASMIFVQTNHLRKA